MGLHLIFLFGCLSRGDCLFQLFVLFPQLLQPQQRLPVSTRRDMLRGRRSKLTISPISISLFFFQQRFKEQQIWKASMLGSGAAGGLIICWINLSSSAFDQKAYITLLVSVSLYFLPCKNHKRVIAAHFLTNVARCVYSVYREHHSSYACSNSLCYPSLLLLKTLFLRFSCFYVFEFLTFVFFFEKKRTKTTNLLNIHVTFAVSINRKYYNNPF